MFELDSRGFLNFVERLLRETSKVSTCNCPAPGGGYAGHRKELTSRLLSFLVVHSPFRAVLHTPENTTWGLELPSSASFVTKGVLSPSSALALSLLSQYSL